MLRQDHFLEIELFKRWTHVTNLLLITFKEEHTRLVVVANILDVRANHKTIEDLCLYLAFYCNAWHFIICGKY